MANFNAGDAAVNLLPNGGIVPVTLVRPHLAAHDGSHLGWVVKDARLPRSRGTWAVPQENLGPA